MMEHSNRQFGSSERLFPTLVLVANCKTERDSEFPLPGSSSIIEFATNTTIKCVCLLFPFHIGLFGPHGQFTTFSAGIDERALASPALVRRTRRCPQARNVFAACLLLRGSIPGIVIAKRCKFISRAQ